MMNSFLDHLVRRQSFVKREQHPDDDRSMDGLLLHYCREGNVLKVAQLLHKHSANVNCIENKRAQPKFTPLHFAAAGGHVQVCWLLLRHRADIRIYEGDFTALHWEAYQKNDLAVKILLANGADVNCTSSVNSHTPLQKAKLKAGSESTVTTIEQFMQNPQIYDEYKCPDNFDVATPVQPSPPSTFQLKEFESLGIELPALVIRNIFEFAHIPTLFIARRVCKAWNSTLSNFLFHQVQAVLPGVAKRVSVRISSQRRHFSSQLQFTDQMVFETKILSATLSYSTITKDSILTSNEVMLIVERLLEIIKRSSELDQFDIPCPIRNLLGILVFSPFVPTLGETGLLVGGMYQ